MAETPLKNNNPKHELTVEEVRKGGINSGKARQEKATMRKTLEMLLDEKNKSGKTYRELATLGLLKGAINGNSQNYKTIVEMVGELFLEDSNGKPNITINVVDNSQLEKTLYETNRHNEND